MCWITERLVERNCLFDQATHYCGFKLVAVVQFDRGHFILAAGLEVVLNFSQALAAPETEQDAPFLCSNEKDRAIECVDQVTPLNALLEVRKTRNDCAQKLDARALPAAQGGYGTRLGLRQELIFSSAMTVFREWLVRRRI